MNKVLSVLTDGAFYINLRRHFEKEGIVSDDKHIRKPNAIIQAGQDLTAAQQNILYSMLRRFTYLANSAKNRVAAVHTQPQTQLDLDFGFESEISRSDITQKLLKKLPPEDVAFFKENHSSEFLEHYHKVALKYEKNGLIQTSLPDTFLSLLKEDPDNFYIMDELKNELSRVTYKIPVREIVSDFKKHKGGDLYRRVKKQVSRLVEQKLTCIEGKVTEFIPIFGYAKVIEGGSDIHVRFNAEVVPYLVNMVKDGYTKLIFKDVYELKGVYAKRVYELLSLNRKAPKVRKQGFFSISIADLRFKLGIDDSKYPRWADFRKRVLDPSIEEIEEKTALRFTLDFERKGRKINTIIFREIMEVDPVVHPNGELHESGAEQVTLDLSAPVKLFNPLLAGITPAQCEQIEKQHSPEFIEYYHKKVKALEKRGRLKSTFAACLFAYITKDEDQYYIREEQKRIAAERKKLEEEKKAKAEAEKKKREAEKMKKSVDAFKQVEASFDALDKTERDKYLNMVREEYPELKDVPELFIKRNAIEFYLQEVSS